ncbi:MAG TPA: penicillin-binding protein activator [Stellaceae bacterium]|nr:penicillin-binding protein activator [Stellaceae bacterium]
MPRRFYAPLASRFAALLLTGALAACAGGSRPAPVVNPLANPQMKPAPITAVTATPMPAPGKETVKVALLLPLSGPNADLGKAMLEAAQLALFTTGSDKLTLIPRDTTGNAGGAADAARSVIADGAKLILGPLIADEVDAVKPIAQAANVNIIAFSTKTEIAGGNVFLIGFLPKQEVAREVSYARDQGLQKFAALAPNTPYGHLMGDALKDVASTGGASLARVEYFDPRLADISASIKHLLPASAAANPAAGGAAAGLQFDALLLPEGGDQLKQIAAQLKTAGIDTTRTRFLGSGLWDDPTIVNDPDLAGGWFAASSPDIRHDFQRRYENAYHHPPPRLASLAFDAAALAAALSKNDSADPFSAQAIQNPSGFTGVDGLFRFGVDGLVQRGLAVLEVDPGGDKVVSPAPQTFQNFVN